MPGPATPPTKAAQNNATGFLGYRQIGNIFGKDQKQRGSLTWFYNSTFADVTIVTPGGNGLLLTVPGFQDFAPAGYSTVIITPQAFVNNVDFGLALALEFDIQASVADTVGLFPSAVIYLPTSQQLITLSFDDVEETGVGNTLIRSKHFILPTAISMHDQIQIGVEVIQVGENFPSNWQWRMSLFNYEVPPVSI